MNKFMSNKCYAVLFIDEYIDYLRLSPIKTTECVDLSLICKDVNNVENIIAYIQDVIKVQDFNIYWTFLDFDHFCELHKEDRFKKMEFFNFNRAIQLMLDGKTVANQLDGKTRQYLYNSNSKKFICQAGNSVYPVKSFYTDAVLSDNWYLV